LDRKKPDTRPQVQNVLAGKSNSQRFKQLEETLGIVRSPHGIVATRRTPVDTVTVVYVRVVRNVENSNVKKATYKCDVPKWDSISNRQLPLDANALTKGLHSSDFLVIPVQFATRRSRSSARRGRV